MPTLQFKGKNIIWNHHLAVPFHTLNEVSDLHYNPEKANGNIIIEGDNLIALKSLLPQFAGEVNVIYIDPPYNTGNEGWAYNDKVNSPLIKEWFGREVGKDDMTRHDKWLCMMTPRLKLLRELLADDGVIFISIDDNEIQNLKFLMNEIFGENNIIANLTVKANPRGRQSDKDIATLHDYLLCYAKNDSLLELNGLPLTDDDVDDFDQEDADGMKWRELGLRQRGAASLREDRPDMFFPIYVNPDNGEISLEHSDEFSIEVIPKKADGRESRWMWGKDKVKNEINRVYARKVRTRDEFDIFIKDYLERENGIRTKKPKSIWIDKDVNTEAGGKLVKSFFPENTFPYPKPIGLIKKILQIAGNENLTILDSFAGSGTTMHAVMDLNKEDGGNRQCIMVQMTEATEAEPEKNICKDITRERIKRAIDKFGYDSGFKYFRVGIPLDAETMLAGQLPTYKQFAKYVYYLCTGENLDKEDSINEETYYVGEFGKQAIYLVYKKDYDTLTRLALNLSMAERIKKEQPGKKRIVYAPSCFLDEEYLTENQIDYVGIPYNLFQRNKE
jgi:adenine-specific DNA-methyltransferase